MSDSEMLGTGMTVRVTVFLNEDDSQSWACESGGVLASLALGSVPTAA